ncbi:MAG: ATP-dependent helicase/nuclease subunit B [Thiomicrorhabdus sp.]|nr:MAG: ATP-dependent helicase/nuclease subunit B [Thiomicrorhabdus sp.]
MKTIHITANSRLSTTLKQRAIQQQSHSVIETPLIMTLPQWWQNWQEGCLLRGELSLDELTSKVLTSFEAQWLWEQVLQQELDDREKHPSESVDKSGSESAGVCEDQQQMKSIALLNVGSTAKQLYQAWTLSAEWFTEAWLEEPYLSDESFLFKKCQARYLKALEKNGWLDEVLVQQQRLQWLEAGRGCLAEQFVLHGFDEITPQIKQWQAVIEARGCLFTIADSSELDQPAEQFCFQALDPQDEVQQVALWCIDQWQTLSQAKQPHEIKIGVVSPNLVDYKVSLIQCLDEQLTAQGLQKLSMKRSQPPFYNLSMGISLLELPLVQNAWLSLQLFLNPQKPCSYSDWSQWLISPYSSGDVVKRQQADSSFRRLQWSNFSWPNLLETEAAKALPKDLKKRLLHQADKSTPSKLSLSEFIGLVWDLLQQLDWTGSRTLNSDEYQQRSKFEEAITQFSMVTEMMAKQTVSAWLSLFKRFLSEQLYQSQSRGLQPIQIIGMLEAGGQQFDALWVLGLTDEAWPRMPNPSPFLPMNLQREVRSPRCDAKRELDYAKQVTARLSVCAPMLVWSYAKQKGDAELLPSPLIPQEDCTGYPAVTYHSLADQIFHKRDAANPLEWVLDAKGPEVPAGSKAPGGTGILQAQSQCPLMAFMDFRLGGKYGIQSVEDGLQNNFQGTLVHEVLEHFWQETKTQVAMLALSDDELKNRLAEHINQSFTELEGTIENSYLVLEQQRILGLCLNWLELEKKRPSFEVIETESEHQIELAGIQFKIIIDRIDKVAGESVIIDYKTGKASINNLMKTPTKAPQLAVYLHALNKEDDTVSGIGYGLLHSDDGVNISAIVAEDEVLQKARSIQVFAKLSDKEGGEYEGTTWTHFLEHLRQEVLDLATDIQQGGAQMVFDSPNDILYANTKLALRLPEVAQQQQDGLLDGEEA